MTVLFLWMLLDMLEKEIGADIVKSKALHRVGFRYQTPTPRPAISVQSALCGHA
jgi:hypothetical protein